MQDYLAFFCIFCNLAHNKYSVNSTSVRAEPILVFFSKFFTLLFYFLTLFRMGFFGAAHKWGGGQKGPPLPKICRKYPTMMKQQSYTLPKEDPKNI